MQILYVAVYLLAIVGANVSTAILGPSWSIVNAFLFIGFTLTTRDKLHDLWNGRHLKIKMLALVVLGSILSFVVYQSSFSIAVASTVSFIFSFIVDAIVYHVNSNKSSSVRMNRSNVASSIVDSFTFPIIAFGSLMPMIMTGQFIAKVLGGYTWIRILAIMGDKEGI
jgi:uncharacterized PurR-regulated membrane protein YhhQ (DUF165 family)